MKYKMKIFLLTTIIGWAALMLAFGFFFDRIIIDIIPIEPAGLKWAIIAAVSLLVAILCTLSTWTFNKHNKMKLDAEAELVANGYSPKYLELLKKQVDALSQNPGNRNFAPAVVRLANAYLVFDEPDAAFHTINRLNPMALKTKFTSSSADQKILMDYFDVQMAVCEEINDLMRADAVMQDARQFIDRIYRKSLMTDLNIDEMCCCYYCMYGDFKIAQSFADHVAGYRGTMVFYSHLLNAKICNYRGDYNGADSYLDAARKLAGKKTVLQSAVYEYQKQLEQKRCQTQQTQ